MSICCYGGIYVDTKKLAKWAELLLDTGKRNNLINFKDTKTSTVEVLYPDASTLFEKVDGTTSLEVYDPKIVDDEASTKLETEDGYPESTKISYLDLYLSRIKKSNQVLIYSPNANPITALKNIEKKARSFIEETGVNVSYIAFGFVHWQESDSSNITFKAPVLLVPILIERESAISPYIIKTSGDEIIVNPTFNYKLDAEYGIRLPDIGEESFEDYLRKVNSIVSKLRWSVSYECKIGIFSFQKINMYRDLKDNSKKILKNDNVRLLLGEPSAHSSVDSETDYVPLANPLVSLHNVVDIDSSQIEALEMLKSGRSFVLQGPPGTGKSQTITNIISECLIDGKKVLFVSEKLAALNVVYEKLRRAGLSEFCLELHSHKSNKKNVIADLCRTLRAERSVVSSKADEEIAIKVKLQQQLDSYAEELHKQREVINKSLFELYETYSAFRNTPEIEWLVNNIESKGEAYLREAESLLEQYVEYTSSIGIDYKMNVWYGYINQDVSYQTRAKVKSDLIASLRFLESLTPVSEFVSKKYEVVCNTINSLLLWSNFFLFAKSTKLFISQILDKSIFEDADNIIKKLNILSSEILAIELTVSSAFDDDIYKLDGNEYNKRLTKQYRGTFSRLFNREYKKIITDMRICKNDGKKVSYSDAVLLSENLSLHQQKTKEFYDLEPMVVSYLQPIYDGVNTDWDYVSSQLNILSTFLSQNMMFGSLREMTLSEFYGEKETFSEIAEKLNSCFSQMSDEYERLAISFAEEIFNANNSCINFVIEKYKNCFQSIEELDNWCRFRELLSRINAHGILSFIDRMINISLDANSIVAVYKKIFYQQWIEYIIFNNPLLSKFNRVSQDKAVSSFSKKDTQQFEINKARIRAKLSSARPSLDMISSGSSLSILIREGEKKRKQKSVRTLLSETGDLVQIIKPCFLMSPLSVSTFLDPDSIYFDVVVFDEASQIFPQDAIGAIYRGKQLIVVGDSKQMPPSNFFTATIDSDDDDEDTGDVTDFESILDLCSTAMRQLRLRWHYRSRFEQLIAFSNKNFYDNDLITFPSSSQKVRGIGVDYHHVDGVFDRNSHTNLKEAEFIVSLIYQNIDSFPERSLGVVAFSVAQQNLIDSLLSKQRQETPEKEFFFKQDNAEPFFIKNLETVQGDERDTIIFSIAYGIDSQGRLLHNFGPLNRTGGERRLNVAVTRAKYNVQLVSSMHHTDIDLKRTSSEGAKLLREYLDFAENGTTALKRTICISSFDQFDSDFELEVCEFLRSHGFCVDTQIGCSKFKIDLGLKLPSSSNYVLAIECDGANYHSSRNARDRDRLRQEILENMGWRFYRIWSTDWYRNKQFEKERLLKAASEAIDKTKPKDKPINIDDTSAGYVYEEKISPQSFEFPKYKVADIHKLSEKYCPFDFLRMVKAILDIEAPLSEEWFLRRIAYLFGREKVTSVVLREYEWQIQGHQKIGILRKNGFLYLKDNPNISFRVPGDVKREIKHISPEELAVGILEILKNNVSAEKSGVYRSLANQCGFDRVGNASYDHFDEALKLLRQQVRCNGEMLSLK